MWYPIKAFIHQHDQRTKPTERAEIGFRSPVPYRLGHGHKTYCHLKSLVRSIANTSWNQSTKIKGTSPNDTCIAWHAAASIFEKEYLEAVPRIYCRRSLDLLHVILEVAYFLPTTGCESIEHSTWATRNQHRHQIASSHTRKTGIVRYRQIEQRTVQPIYQSPDGNRGWSPHSLFKIVGLAEVKFKFSISWSSLWLHIQCGTAVSLVASLSLRHCAARAARVVKTWSNRAAMKIIAQVNESKRCGVICGNQNLL